jgi:hypothetical protein
MDRVGLGEKDRPDTFRVPFACLSTKLEKKGERKDEQKRKKNRAMARGFDKSTIFPADKLNARTVQLSQSQSSHPLVRQ